MTPKNNSHDNPPPAESMIPQPHSLADVASRMTGTVKDFSKRATDKIEDTRSAAANGFEFAASAVHGGGKKVAGAAHLTAEKLRTTAAYLRNHNSQGIWEDVEQAVKQNPGITLVVAGMIGFMLGRALRPREQS